MGEQDTQEKTGTVKDALNPQNDQPAASKGATETPAPTTFTQDQFEKEAEKRVAAALSKVGRDVVIIDRDAAVDSGDIVVCVLEEDCQLAAPVIEVRRRLK